MLAATAPVAWTPHLHAAAAYANQRAGRTRIAVRTPDARWSYRGTEQVASASVLKVMLMVADLNRRHPDRPLDKPMIQRSDNAAASAVLGTVGDAAVRRVARRAHMQRFALVHDPWGNSRIDAIDQARFMLHVDRYVPPARRAYAMHLLRTVTPSQRWGIGRVHLPGWTKYFKSGWGSGTGSVEHQVMLLQRGTARVAVAVLITSSPSHAYAKHTLHLVLRDLLNSGRRPLRAARRAPRDPPPTG